MKLSTWLVLLVFGCSLPILVAQSYSQIKLYGARERQVNELVMRQAELVDAHVDSIIQAVDPLGAIAAEFPDVAATKLACSERLTALHHGLLEYDFLAVYASGGDLLCGSAPAPGSLDNFYRQWITDVASGQGARVGPLVQAGTPLSPFLPVGIRVRDASNGSDARVFVAALDLNWLAKQVETMLLGHDRPFTRATLTVTDLSGVIVARFPEGQPAIGKPLPAWQKSLISRRSRGVEVIKSPDGSALLAAYVPVGPTSPGLTVIETVALAEATTDIDQATFQGFLVTGAAAFAAMSLAWLAGRRFVHQPTEALLLAARKWREGDLSARATLGKAGSEFSALSQSFNAMAADLQAREVELRLQISSLEAQVAERTRELSESNNRLQVEIAGREKTEAALHQSQKLQAVGQLAGGIAHDFNNMLATVLGNLDLMERRVSQTEKEWTQSDTERLMRLVARATGAVQRGSQLTSRLLAFSRRQRLAARSTDINALLRELITLATSTLGRGVQVVAELAEDLWAAMVDPSQVEAAILNLCLNARDAMPSGGRLTISTANIEFDPDAEDIEYNHDLPSGAFVRICISDTGVGMTAEVRARAFDPFFTTKGPHGTGLGLSQVYGMARQAGGNAIIDSTLGKGTSVTLLLPKATQSEAIESAPPHVSVNHSLTGTMPADLVLVVDDDAAVRQVTVEMTRDLGCEVAQAAGGEQALALIDKLSPAPSVVLLDYAMPGMNGLQLARALRERGVTAPVALVTGYAELSESDIADAQLSGLLRKPFTISELHALLVQLRATAAEPLAQPCFEPGLMDT